jgi:DNA-binding transcriptional MerR regulator
MSGEQQSASSRETSGGARFTVEELSRRAGMSTRNIRAHQARGLLTAPVRCGRTAYYDVGHLRRLETIHELQQQGYNLVAIATILGVRERPGTDDLTPVLDWLRTQQPAMVHALSRHRIVARGDDGRIRTIRPRALRASLAMGQVGIHAGPAMQLLSEALDRVSIVADELILSISSHMLAMRPGQTASTSWPDIEQASALLTERMAQLLVEAFRVAIENRGQDILLDLVARNADGDHIRRSTAAVDYG